MTVHSLRLLLLIPLAALLGCTVENQLVVQHDKLAPVALDRPKVKLPVQAPDDVEVDARFVCRGGRGGVLLLGLTNTGPSDIEFTPRLIGLQLSSGHRHRFMTATEFERMCTEFGAASYGIRDGDEAAVAQWNFPEEKARYLLERGQVKEIALSFGAQPQEAWLVLDFDPALKRAKGAETRGKFIVAVSLPDVLPPPKTWLPPWLHFGVEMTNGG